MAISITRLTCFLLGVLMLSSCKLAVIVVEGGEVQSTASGTCTPAVPGTSGMVCIHEITATTYAETFTAVPDTGWHFVKWNAGDGFLCGNRTNPVCPVTNVPLAGNAIAEAIVASNQTYNLMPVFAEGDAITETVTVFGKKWAQPGLFHAVSRAEVQAVCSTGACFGTLDGWSMNGWTWATVEDLNALFNNYIGANEMGPGQDEYSETSSTWGPQFFAAFHSTETAPHGIGEVVSGFVREPGVSALAADGISGLSDTFSTQEPDGRPHGFPGAWFYRVL